MLCKVGGGADDARVRACGNVISSSHLFVQTWIVRVTAAARYNAFQTVFLRLVCVFVFIVFWDGLFADKTACSRDVLFWDNLAAYKMVVAHAECHASHVCHSPVVCDHLGVVERVDQARHRDPRVGVNADGQDQHALSIEVVTRA